MSDTPTTVNGPAETANKIIHAAIFDVALEGAEKGMIANLPFLGFPFINTIFKAVFTWIANYIYSYLSRLATFSVIDIQIGTEKTAYTTAEKDLRAAELSGDKNALTQATVEFRAALGPLIHYDGSASP